MQVNIETQSLINTNKPIQEAKGQIENNDGKLEKDHPSVIVKPSLLEQMNEQLLPTQDFLEVLKKGNTDSTQLNNYNELKNMYDYTQPDFSSVQPIVSAMNLNAINMQTVQSLVRY